MAMQKVVHQLPEFNERPIWWTNPIPALVQEVADAGSAITHLSDGKSGNQFGLAASFRVQFVTQRLATSLVTWRDLISISPSVH